MLWVLGFHIPNSLSFPSIFPSSSTSTTHPNQCPVSLITSNHSLSLTVFSFLFCFCFCFLFFVFFFKFNLKGEKTHLKTWACSIGEKKKKKNQKKKPQIQQVLFMDWGWGKFSGEPIFPENKQNPPSSFSDSIGSNKGSSQESSSSHGSSKRIRLLHGSQNQTCLVDGCDTDLTNCKDYHRRHRVCDSHSKTPVVLVRGEEKRFCQQCSRFHSLGEFDEVKRSCRKRLDGHNRRRRKPQPESLFMSSTDFLSNCKGPIVLQFSDQQIHHVPDELGRSLWPVRTEGEEKSSMVPPNSSAYFSYGRGDNKQLPFFLHKNGTRQGKQMVSSQLSFNQQLPDVISQGSEMGNQKPVPTDTSLEDSGCALYLLSSHQVQAHPDAGLSTLVQSHLSVPIQTHETELDFSSPSDFSGSFGSKDKPVCKTNLHSESVLEMEEESDGLFRREAPHKFPIYWE